MVQDCIIDISAKELDIKEISQQILDDEKSIQTDNLADISSTRKESRTIFYRRLITCFLIGIPGIIMFIVLGYPWSNPINAIGDLHVHWMIKHSILLMLILSVVTIVALIFIIIGFVKSLFIHIDLSTPLKTAELLWKSILDQRYALAWHALGSPRNSIGNITKFEEYSRSLIRHLESIASDIEDCECKLQLCHIKEIDRNKELAIVKVFFVTEKYVRNDDYLGEYSIYEQEECITSFEIKHLLLASNVGFQIIDLNIKELSSIKVNGRESLL